MTVYLVMYWNYDDVQMMGVFAVETLAQKFIDAYRPKGEAAYLTIFEEEVKTA